MPEQDYVTIPNQPGFAGTPTMAPIEVDDLSMQGAGPFRQRMTVLDRSALQRMMMNAMAGALGAGIDPGTGRMRVVFDSVTGSLNWGSINQIMGFGSGGANAITTTANYLPFELTADAWATSVRSCIT